MTLEEILYKIEVIIDGQRCHENHHKGRGSCPCGVNDEMDELKSLIVMLVEDEHNKFAEAKMKRCVCGHGPGFHINGSTLDCHGACDHPRCNCSSWTDRSDR